MNESSPHGQGARWTVGGKIAAGFAVIVILFIGLGAVAFQSLKQVNSTIREVKKAEKTDLAIRALEKATLDAETGQRGFIITGEQSFLAPYEAGIEEIGKRQKELRRRLDGDQRQERRLDRLEPVVTAKLADMNETIELRRRDSRAAQRQVALGIGKKLQDQIRLITKQMGDREDALLEQRLASTGDRAVSAQNTIIFGIILLALITGFIGLMLARNISSPLRAMTKVASDISGGDISGSLSTQTRNDEIGDLNISFQRVKDYLEALALAAQEIATGDLRTRFAPVSERDELGKAFTGMIEGLRTFAAETTDAAAVLAGSTSDVVQLTGVITDAAQDTASSVTETTSTVEQARHSAEETNERTKAVAKTARESVSVSEEGKNSADGSIEAMGAIEKQMEEIADSVVKLSEQSKSIGQIISSVNDLAEQSKLLSVNASIEAAKAGEQGKGFAVVAQEIKSLADQSKQATAQISGILSDIRKATDGAVMATERGTKTVAIGVTSTAKAGTVITELAANIGRAAQAVEQIAAANRQQLAGMEQIAIAMENIESVNAQTLEGTNQFGQTNQDLHHLGERLEAVAERYQVA